MKLKRRFTELLAYEMLGLLTTSNQLTKKWY